MQPRSHPILLFNERDKIAPRTSVIQELGSPRSTRISQPTHLYSFSSYSSVELAFNLEKINGNPTALSLKPRLQIGIAHTRGYQFTNTKWITLTREQCERRCPTTGWFPDLTESTTSGEWDVIIERPSARMRINFGEYYTPAGAGVSPTALSVYNASHPDAFTMTGGTNPNLQIALIGHGKK